MIRVHDAKTGAVLFTSPGVNCGQSGEPHLAFSPDGQWFAAAVPSDDPEIRGTMLRVWESATGKVRVSLAGPGGQPVFSPDGRTVAVNHEDAVVLFELSTGQARHEFRHHGTVEPGLVWRSDGRVLAAASSEAPVYLWDVAGDRTGTAPTWDATEDNGRWSALIGTEVPAAFQALRQLWAHPAKAVEFLRTRMGANPDARLASRGCEALELIGTAEAKRLLTVWAAGPPGNALTREAKDSLRRLPRT
jgi:hypothetical protein